MMTFAIILVHHCSMEPPDLEAGQYTQSYCKQLKKTKIIINKKQKTKKGEGKQQDHSTSEYSIKHLINVIHHKYSKVVVKKTQSEISLEFKPVLLTILVEHSTLCLE